MTGRAKPDDRRLAAAFAQLDRQPADRSDCPAAEALLAIVEGPASESARLTVLGHVATCSACRKELDLLRTAAVAAEGPGKRPTVPWALAASVLLAVSAGAVWMTLRTGPEGSSVRSGTHRIETVAPEEVTATPVAFVWRAEPDAQSYRVTVVDSSGTVVWSGQATDTTAPAPPEAGLTAAAEYRWWIEAYLRDGTSTRSEVRRFRISP